MSYDLLVIVKDSAGVFPGVENADTACTSAAIGHD